MICYSAADELPISRSSMRDSCAGPIVDEATRVVDVPLDGVAGNADTLPLILSPDLAGKTKKPRSMRTPKAKLEPTTNINSDKADVPLLLNLDV